MMLEPPIDELAAKVDNNKYELTIIMAKRAKELQKRIPELLNGDKKEISLAAEEIYREEIIPSNKVVQE